MADQTYFEDVSVGDAIPALSVSVDQTQMFFFSAATYNGHMAGTALSTWRSAARRAKTRS
jgi:hypothetical protein